MVWLMRNTSYKAINTWYMNIIMYLQAKSPKFDSKANHGWLRITSIAVICEIHSLCHDQAQNSKKPSSP